MKKGEAEAPPRVLIMPDTQEQGSGLTSTIAFNRPSFMRGLREMFQCQDDERITQVEIQDGWITARITTEPQE